MHFILFFSFCPHVGREPKKNDVDVVYLSISLKIASDIVLAKYGRGSLQPAIQNVFFTLTKGPIRHSFVILLSLNLMFGLKPTAAALLIGEMWGPVS